MVNFEEGRGPYTVECADCCVASAKQKEKKRVDSNARV